MTRIPPTQRATLLGNRQRLAMLDLLPDGITCHDKMGRYLYANQQALKDLGQTSETLLGRSYHDIGIDPALCGQFDAAIAKVFATGTPVTPLEYPLGSRWFQSTVVPSLAPDGTVEFACVTTRSVTEQKTREIALTYLQEGVGLYEGCYSEDGKLTDLRILFVSDRATTFSGIAREAQIGRTWRELLPDVPEALIAQYSQAEQDMVPRQFEYQEHSTLAWYLVTITPLPAHQFVTTFIDITDRKQAEMQLQQTRDHYQALFNQMSEGFCIIEVLWDEQGEPRDYRFIETNQAFTEQSGLGDVVGKRIREVVPDLEPIWFTLYGQVVRTGQPIQFEQHAAPLERWFAVSAFRIAPEQTGLVAILFTDITARKKAEQELQQMELQLRLFAESNVIGLLFGDTDGGISYANGALLQMVGYDHDDVSAGRLRWDLLTPPEWLPMDAQGIEEARQRGVCTPYEKEYIRKDGTRVPILVGFTMYGERPEKTVAFVLDLSDIKRLERHKDEFIGLVSHELRTPVTSLKLYNQLVARRIRQQGENVEILNLLDRMQRQVQQMETLISDLLDVTRLEGGRLQYHLGPVDLNSVVREVVEAVQPTTDQHIIEVALPDFPPITGDRERLAQVLTNLLTNAVKYSPNARIVRVIGHLTEHDVVLGVQDFGIGIPADQVAQVFEKFHRVDTQATRTISGLGLGLYISREIVAGHSGRMWIESTEGQGSTFWLELPLAPVA